MRLRVRPAGPADLAPYFTAFGDPFAYDAYSAGLAKRVPRVWETLIALSAMVAIVFEDLERPRERRAVGLAASVFVTGAFATKAESDGPPYVRAQLIEQILSGKSPVASPLSPSAAECENGLSLFSLTSCALNPGLACEDHHLLIESKIRADLQLHRGYHLERIFGEICGPEETRTMLGGGFRLRRSYKEYSAPSRPPLLRPRSTPTWWACRVRRRTPRRRAQFTCSFWIRTPIFHSEARSRCC